MVARYKGICARCLGVINAGEEIKWNRKRKGIIYHPVCPNGAVNGAVEAHEMDYNVGSPFGESKWIDNANVEDIKRIYHFYGNTEGMKSAMENLTRAEFNSQFPLTDEQLDEFDRIHFNTTAKQEKESRDFQTMMETYGQKREEKTMSMSAVMTAEANEINAISTKQHANGNNGDLAAVLASAIQGHLKTTASVDASQVREIVKSELAGMGALPTRVEIVTAENVTRDMGVQHHTFPKLLKALSAGVNVWLAGPAGSGKTTASEKCAEALDIPFYFCGAQSNEYGLLGYRTATGELVRTAFREAFENGGVFLFDEIDASAPAALLAFNAALANGMCAFPDGMIKKHPKFVAIAAANTFGLGGNNDYVGRMKQDAAFLDRFIFMSWDIDESLETTLSGNVAWSGYVQSVRSRVRSKGIKVVISPRASIYGAKLLAAGMDIEDVKALTLRKGMDVTQWESVA